MVRGRYVDGVTITYFYLDGVSISTAHSLEHLKGMNTAPYVDGVVSEKWVGAAHWMHKSSWHQGCTLRNAFLLNRHLYYLESRQTTAGNVCSSVNWSTELMRGLVRISEILLSGGIFLCKNHQKTRKKGFSFFVFFSDTSSEAFPKKKKKNRHQRKLSCHFQYYSLDIDIQT